MHKLNSHHVRVDYRLLIALAAATVLIHLLCSTGYGYFRDELYMIACSKHLAWGYVDQPPFSVFVLAIVGRTLGYSQFALRLVPALCGGAVAFLIGLMARRLGGGRLAQTLAVSAYMAGGVFLAVSNYYSMNCFDHLFWAVSIYVLIRILQGSDIRLWLVFGLVAGLGLENKYSMGFLGLGLIAGLALTPARRHFRDKWLWAGGALATLLFLPHVCWEIQNHFPTAEFIRNATLKKNLPMTPWAFLMRCVLMVNPATLPIWLAGFIYLVRGPKSEVRSQDSVPLLGDLQSGVPRQREDLSPSDSGPRTSGFGLSCLAWIFLAVLGILLSSNSKPYYFAPAFLLLLPAGGVAMEVFAARRHWKWLVPGYLSVLALGGALLAPLVLPVLPVDRLARYQAWLGVKAGEDERGEQSQQIPQFLGDRLGWPELTAQVARIYDHLSPEDKAVCVIGAHNYGEAGAIDFFGGRYGLPNAISTHNNFWFWGPGAKPGTVLLVIGGSKAGYERLYEDVQLVATFTYCYAPESNVPIFLCRRPKCPLQEYWPQHHNFI